MTAMEMAAASYLSSGSPMAAILSVVSSSLSDPYNVSKFSSSCASVQTLLSVLSAHLKKIIWRPNILVIGLLLREVAGQLSALVEDAGQVAHGVVPEVPVVVHLLEELIEVILVNIDQAFTGLPLRPP